MARFSEVDYGPAPKAKFARALTADQVARNVRTLQEVKEQVERHYPASKTKSMAGRIDSAIKSLQSWKA